MRRALLICSLVCIVQSLVGDLRAQSVRIVDAIEPILPNLTVTLVRETSRDVGGVDLCDKSSTILWECEGNPGPKEIFYTLGTDVSGALYYVAGKQQTFRDRVSGVVIKRMNRSGLEEDVARWIQSICLDGPCTGVINYQVRATAFDPANGILVLAVHGAKSQDDPDRKVGILDLTGLPTMFDTLLTFVPSGQVLSAVVPAHPDGFRSADSLQVWTGNVRSMPDWSLAHPLSCEAAVDPLPGQIVSVADTLPDPSVGEGRYYLVASQSSGDRRLGRQYVNGAFSARQPTGLPVCQ